jgi:hypothetical protein
MLGPVARNTERLNVMAVNFLEWIARLWSGMNQKTGTVVSNREAALVRGRVAARSVRDAAGNVIVDAGHPIDEAVIARARMAGRLPAVLAVAMTAKTQDLKEKFHAFYNRTEAGQEARALKSVDSYVEARNYLGRVLEIDVTDIRGTVIVPAGKAISNEDIRACRDAEQLGALIFAAEQAPPAPADQAPTPGPAEQEHTFYTPPPPRTAPTFLVAPEENEVER